MCLRGSKVQYLLQWYVLTKVLGTEYGLCMVVLLLPLVFFKTKCLSLYTYYCTYLAMNKLPRTPTHNYCPLLTLELRTLAVLLMSNKLIKLSSHLFNLWGDISYQEGAVTRYKFYNVFGHMSWFSWGSIQGMQRKENGNVIFISSSLSISLLIYLNFTQCSL